MNGVDLLIVGLFAGGLLFGYRRGLIRQAVDLTGFIAAYFVAFQFTGDLSPLLKDWFPLTQFEPYSNFRFVDEGMEFDQVFYNGLAFAMLFFCHQNSSFIRRKFPPYYCFLTGNCYTKPLGRSNSRPS